MIHTSRSRFRFLRLEALPIALAVIVAACAGPLRTPREPEGPRLSVLTYNVNVGAPRPEAALEAIREAGADIVCLQETSPFWEEYLRPRLAETYPHIIFRHAGGAGGLAVLSKMPLREVAYFTPRAGWFPAWVLEASTPLGAVKLVCVHLRPPLGEGGSVSASAYLEKGDVHEAEIAEVWSRVTPGRPVVVLGDFNEDDGGRALDYLTERGLVDAVRLFDRRTYTWRWRTSVVTLRGRYDHILTSRELECASARIIEEGASDHYLVLAVLERAGGG